MDRKSVAGWGLALAGWILIGALTLYPDPDSARQAAETPMWCLLCGDLGSVDFLLNIALFIPLGAGLAMAGRGAGIALALGFISSLAVETSQATILLGRDPSLGDLAANSIGTVAGWLLATNWSRWLLPSTAAARRWGRASLVLGIAVQFVTGWGLKPAAPEGRYYGQWRQERPGEEVFPGQVVSASLNRVVLPRGAALTESSEIRQELLDVTSSLTVTAVTNGPTASYAPIAAIAFHKPFQLAALGQEGNDLIATRRFRISSLLLRSPALALRDILPQHDTVHLISTLRRDNWAVLVRTGNSSDSMVVHPSPSWTWAMLIPWDQPLTGQPGWATAAWLIAMLTLPGYWYGMSGLSRRRLAPELAFALALALGFVPYHFRMSPVMWYEWLAAACGLALGLAAAALVGPSSQLRRRAVDQPG